MYMPYTYATTRRKGIFKLDTASLERGRASDKSCWFRVDTTSVQAKEPKATAGRKRPAAAIAMRARRRAARRSDGGPEPHRRPIIAEPSARPPPPAKPGPARVAVPWGGLRGATQSPGDYSLASNCLALNSLMYSRLLYSSRLYEA